MHNSYSGLLGHKVDKASDWNDGNTNWRRNLDPSKNSPTYYKNIRLRQQINEDEQNILQKKIPCGDGTMEDLVTCYNTQNEWLYICHACNTTRIVWKELSRHIQTWWHKGNVQKLYNRTNVFSRDESGYNENPKKRLDEMWTTNDNHPVGSIQAELNKCYEPLIGLEYLLEIVDKSENCSYYCLLCNITLSGQLKTIISHASIQSHWSKYLEKYFPSAAEKLDKIGFREDRHVRYKLYKHVVGRIQHVFGRLRPTRVKKNIFDNNKKSIFDKVENGKHFKEQRDASFVGCVSISHVKANRCRDTWTGQRNHSPRRDSKDIKSLMSTVVDEPPGSSQAKWESQGNDAHRFDRKDPDRDLRKILDNNYSHSRKPTTGDSFRSADSERSRHFQQDQKNLIQDTEPPSFFVRFEEEERRFYEYSRSNDDTNLWQNYQKRVQMIEANLLDELRYYRETPQKHPKYDEERKEYYEKRNEELISMGEDPRNYDIKVEWDAFWDIRLNRLFKEIFEKEKAQLRQQLQFLQTGNKVDDKQSFNDLKGHTNFENQSFNFTNSNNKLDASEKYKKSFHDDHGRQPSHIAVIPVLRQLSVLEQNLGSLGPKVVDLLSTALMLEKSSESGADAIMLSGENCILLETVKEKLKGFCQSGLLPEAMVSITEASIHSISELLDSATEKEKSLKSNYNVSHIDEPKAFSNDKRFGTNERRPYSSNEKKPLYNEGRLRSEEKRFQSKERARSSEKRPRSNERRPRTPEKRFRSAANERQSHSNEQTRLTGKYLFSNEHGANKNERKLHTHQEASYNDDRIIYNKDVFISEGNRYQTKTFLPTRSLNVSEINLYVEKLGILSDLTFIQRAAISQQIGSLLLIRGVVEITEDELLLLIKTLIPNSAPSNLVGNIQSASLQFQSQYSAPNISGRTAPDRGLGILETNANYLMNQRVNPTYAQSSPFIGGSNMNMVGNTSMVNKHAGSTNITYPLNANPYKSSGASSRRKM